MDLAVTSSSEDGITHLWDLRAGTPLLQYKGNKAERNGVDILAGKMMVVSQSDRPAIHVWVWQRDQPHLKFACSEKMAALVLSSSGSYCVGGSITGKLYIWEIASGELLRVFDAHYGKINVLKFTDDDSLLISGGEDATINVWELGSLLNESLETSVTTLHSWTDHSLAITDLHVGFGGSSARVVSSSLDCSCKVWDLARGTMLCSLVFPVYISTVVMDPCEYRIFGGGGNGEIYVADFYHFSSEQGYQAIPRQSAVEKKAMNMFVGHTAPITKLSVSFDGTLLLSASEDSKAIVWDVQCRQMLRTFSQHKGPVNFAAIIPRPNVDLFGTDLPPLPPFSLFKRFAKVRGAQATEGTPVNLNPKNRDHAARVTPSLSTPLYLVSKPSSEDGPKASTDKPTAQQTPEAASSSKAPAPPATKPLTAAGYQQAVHKLVKDAESSGIPTESPPKKKKGNK